MPLLFIFKLQCFQEAYFYLNNFYKSRALGLLVVNLGAWNLRSNLTGRGNLILKL